jgi:hypothetical protein
MSHKCSLDDDRVTDDVCPIESMLVNICCECNQINCSDGSSRFIGPCRIGWNLVMSRNSCTRLDEVLRVQLAHGDTLLKSWHRFQVTLSITCEYELFLTWSSDVFVRPVPTFDTSYLFLFAFLDDALINYLLRSTAMCSSRRRRLTVKVIGNKTVLFFSFCLSNTV